MTLNRRDILRGGSALGFSLGTGLLGSLAARPAFAADTNGYKALVSVFFKGGLDSMDTILPVDAPSYDKLAALRGELFSAYGTGTGASTRDRANLLELAQGRVLANTNLSGRRFGLPPNMSGLHNIFEAGDAAIVGNVGPLIAPTTRDQFVAGNTALPPKLFSHNDQQSVWMSLSTEGTQLGWGGQFVDKAIAGVRGDAATFSAISTTGTDVFLFGEQARPFPASGGGPVDISLLSQPFRMGNTGGTDRARALLRDHFASQNQTPSSLYQKDLVAENQKTFADSERFAEILAMGTQNPGPFPDTPIGNQLKTVADIISLRGAFGVSRQMFYCAIGDFDTHADQASKLPILQAQISEAFAAFHAAMVQQAIQDSVTLFTTSDFGRTAIDNGDGTDHGWGGHHIVMGGAVKGGEIYGDIPSYDVDSQSYTPSRGRLIPSTSVDQYAATLGRWFGLSGADLTAVLPNLGNFTNPYLDLFA